MKMCLGTIVKVEALGAADSIHKKKWKKRESLIKNQPILMNILEK